MPSLLGRKEPRALRGPEVQEDAWTVALYQVFQGSPDAIVISDEAGKVLDVNDSFLRLTGYRRDEAVGRTVFELDLWVDDQDRGQVTASLADLGHMGGRETRFRTRSGEARCAQFSLQGVDSGSKRWVVLIGRDITEQKEAEEALHITLDSLMRINEQRKKLLERLVSAQEEERRRISTEIHDDTIQAIASARMSLNLLRRSLHDTEQAQLLARTEARVKTALGRLRNLAFDLRPPALEGAGLEAAMIDHLGARVTEAGLEWHLDNRMSGEPPSETGIVMYRIAQEAVANVLKHARATRVDVVLEEEEDGFLLRVTDDGVGSPARNDESFPGHFGITCMNERAELAGGWCRVRSAPGGGTTVECWVPGIEWSLFAKEERERKPDAQWTAESLRSIWDGPEEVVEDASAAG